MQSRKSRISGAITIFGFEIRSTLVSCAVPRVLVDQVHSSCIYDKFEICHRGSFKNDDKGASSTYDAGLSSGWHGLLGERDRRNWEWHQSIKWTSLPCRPVERYLSKKPKPLHSCIEITATIYLLVFPIGFSKIFCVKISKINFRNLTQIHITTYSCWTRGKFWLGWQMIPVNGNPE